MPTFICHLPVCLTAAWPWKAPPPSEDEAAILSDPLPPLNPCQKSEDSGGGGKVAEGESVDGEVRGREDERLLPRLTHLAFVLWAVAQMNHGSWMSFSGSVGTRTKLWWLITASRSVHKQRLLCCYDVMLWPPSNFVKLYICHKKMWEAFIILTFGLNSLKSCELMLLHENEMKWNEMCVKRLQSKTTHPEAAADSFCQFFFPSERTRPTPGTESNTEMSESWGWT